MTTIGTLLLTLVITLVLSGIGAAMIVGVRLMIDKAQRDRDARALRRWRTVGLVVTAIPLLLVGGLGVAVAGLRHLGSVAGVVAGSHLVWLAVAATLATAVLVFSGDLGNDAIAWRRFRHERHVRSARVDRYREAYRSADAAGIRLGMELVQGAKLYTLTYGEPPTLPPLDRDVEHYLRDRFSHVLLPHPDDDNDAAPDGGAAAVS